MKPFNDTTVATITNSADLVASAADEIALRIYSQLKRRSSKAADDEESGFDAQCVASIATLVRDVANNIGVRDARERFSDQVKSFQMHRSGYAIAGDVLKPVLQDVLGANATDRLCAAWGDVYWSIASPLSQDA